jgi:hypothetical protein
MKPCEIATSECSGTSGGTECSEGYSDRYVTEEGAYLRIDSCGPISICWYFPEDDDDGSELGRETRNPPGVPDLSDDPVFVWEETTACEAVKPYACSADPAYGYRFPNVHQAWLALAAANHALRLGVSKPS